MAAPGPAMTGPGRGFFSRVPASAGPGVPGTNRIAASFGETAFHFSDRGTQGLMQVDTAC